MVFNDALSNADVKSKIKNFAHASISRYAHKSSLKSNGPVFIHCVERGQTIVYDLLLMKSNVKDPHMALVALEFTTIMESHMFIKMCPIILKRKVSQ